jgi:putative hemolysin
MAEPGLDGDVFDPHCDHLIARDRVSGEVVGTYRILLPEGALRLGCYYAETEFDLARWLPLRGGLAELGRSCVAPAWRGTSVLGAMWSGLTRYVVERGIRHLAGCASIRVTDGGHAAASLHRLLVASRLAPIEHRVFPLSPLRLSALDQERAVTVPPLLGAYLRAGAWVCGAPAYDPDFETADFLLLLPIAAIRGRYARRFVNRPVPAATSRPMAMPS